MAVDREALILFLDEKLGIDTESIDDRTNLFSGGLLDSFSMVELMMFIETQGRFKMNPMDVNLDNLDSIERILGFVTRSVNAGGG